MMLRLPTLATVLILALAPGGPDTDGRPSEAVIQRPDTVRARLELTIGDESAAAPHSFGAISGVALDRAGRIYVSDLQETHVAVFAPSGKPLATIGRKGAGPGEFEGPSGPAIGPDGGLFVRDISKVARFVVDPATGLATKHDRDFRGPLYPNWTSRRASRVDRDGRFGHPVMNWKTGGEVRHAVLRYSAQGTFVDSVPVPSYANEPIPTASVRTSPNGGRMIRGLNYVPFAPIPVWDFTAGGTIVSGDAQSYLLIESDAAGRTVRRFERSIPAARIDRDERGDSAKALQRRIDSLPVPIARVEGTSEAVRTQTLPATYPLYSAVFAAEDGRVWVRRWPPAGRGAETFFDVFDATSRFLGTVVLPVSLAAGHHPVIRGDMLVGVTIDRDTDLESVVRLRFDPWAPAPLR
jgi:hypothetical protein